MNYTSGRRPESRWKSPTSPQKSSSEAEYYAKVGLLMEMAKYKLDVIFEYFDLDMRWNGRRFMGTCPVHGGDDRTHFIFWPTGYKDRACWMCLSHHCEEYFIGNVVGFVRGCLSHSKYGWERQGDKEVANRIAVETLCEILDTNMSELRPDMIMTERGRFVDNIEAFIDEKPVHQGICSRREWRSRVEMPAEYYLGRGYTREVLDRHDVGLCPDPDDEMYGRVVVPIYTADGKVVLGCIGRSTHPKCPECEKYHAPGDPCHGPNSSKWLTSSGFTDKDHLYNFWNATDHVKECGRTIVVVEGCGDVWRLEEAGIFNTVALNGANLSDSQWNDLGCSEATKILCVTDNDDGGHGAHRQIEKKCSRWLAKVKRIVPEGAKDVGDLSIDDPLFDYIKDYIARRAQGMIE